MPEKEKEMLTQKIVENIGIVPVIVLEDAAKAVPLAKVLVEGGIPIMEITFRTAAARASIEAVSKEVPDMIVGAGTVITMEQLEDAISAGAQFIVSPGLDPEIVRACQKKGIPVFPGIVTPSEILTGLNLGIEVFKFFPAGSYGGVSTLKALSGPFPQIKFLPTGGISDKNAAEYYAVDQVLAIGGSWMAPSKLVDAGDFDQILEEVKKAVAVFKAARP